MKGEKRFDTRLAEVCYALNAARAHYVLIGAAAMQLWGTTRATRDVDILIEPTVPNARRVLKALAQLGLGFAARLVPEDLAARPVTIVGDIPNVDIFTRAWNLKYADAAHGAVAYEVEGVKIPVASIAHLIESKRTGRLQDAADIEVLEEIQRRRGG